MSAPVDEARWRGPRGDHAEHLRLGIGVSGIALFTLGVAALFVAPSILELDASVAVLGLTMLAYSLGVHQQP